MSSYCSKNKDGACTMTEDLHIVNVSEILEAYNSLKITDSDLANKFNVSRNRLINHFYQDTARIINIQESIDKGLMQGSSYFFLLSPSNLIYFRIGIQEHTDITIKIVMTDMGMSNLLFVSGDKAKIKIIREKYKLKILWVDSENNEFSFITTTNLKCLESENEKVVLDVDELYASSFDSLKGV